MSSTSLTNVMRQIESVRKYNANSEQLPREKADIKELVADKVLSREQLLAWHSRTNSWVVEEVCCKYKQREQDLKPLCSGVGACLLQASQKAESLKEWAAGKREFPLPGYPTYHTPKDLVRAALDDVFGALEQFKILANNSKFNKAWDPIRECYLDYVTRCVQYAILFMRLCYSQTDDTWFVLWADMLPCLEFGQDFIFDSDEFYKDSWIEVRTLEGVITPIDRLPLSYMPRDPETGEVISRTYPRFTRAKGPYRLRVVKHLVEDEVAEEPSFLLSPPSE